MPEKTDLPFAKIEVEKLKVLSCKIQPEPT